MPKWIARAVALALATAPAASAQSSPSDDVVRTVERLFAAMAARDTATLRALVAPDLVIVASRESDTASMIRRQTVPDFLRAIASSPDVPRERMWSPDVRVDGAVATLWAPYDFHRGERFSHCGHDAFALARTGGAWVVTGLTYTVRAAPCAPPPTGEADAVAAIRAERARFNDAVARRDTNVIARVLLPSYQILTGRSVPTVGRDAARHQWAESFRTDSVAWYVRTPREIRVSATAALAAAEELGDWDGRLTMSGAVAHVGGRYAAKWQRDADGAWKLRSEVFTLLRCDGPGRACEP